jgi:hypothetical protein
MPRPIWTLLNKMAVPLGFHGGTLSLQWSNGLNRGLIICNVYGCSPWVLFKAMENILPKGFFRLMPDLLPDAGPHYSSLFLSLLYIGLHKQYLGLNTLQVNCKKIMQEVQ